MRPIKFRAWDKQAKNMLRVNAIDFKNKEFLEAEDFDAPKGATKSVIVLPKGLFPEHFDLMQFTGLKDKNGKEIYEGDIVSISNNKYVCEYRITEWSGEFRFMILPHKIWFDGSDRPKEVIGNRFDNPSLIEEKDA